MAVGRAAKGRFVAMCDICKRTGSGISLNSAAMCQHCNKEIDDIQIKMKSKETKRYCRVCGILLDQSRYFRCRLHTLDRHDVYDAEMDGVQE